MPRVLTLLVLAAIALTLVPTMTAAAAAQEPRRYVTDISARDNTDFTVRSGKKGAQCGIWVNIEGHALTTISPVGVSTMVLYPKGARYPGSGKPAPLLAHGLLKGEVRSKLTIASRKHVGPPCGCGPNSEMGKCPPAVPDQVVNDTCRKQGTGSLGVTHVKRKLNALAGADVQSILKGCRYGGQNWVPSDYGLPADVPLPASALDAILGLKVGAQTQIRETYQHAGKQLGCPSGTLDKRESVCGVLTFEMKVRRTA